jgi:preprotein translocase subunit SecD
VDARKSIDVFINRVHELKTDYFSSIESTVDVNGATITFIGFNPDIELLEYYAKNKGQLNAKIIGRYGVIVDSSDIENALPELIGNNPVISVQISEAAGIKMHKITNSNLGARIEMKLDGSVILRGAITEPLGRFFRLGGSGSISDVSKQAILLKYGALENELFLTKIN